MKRSILQCLVCVTMLAGAVSAPGQYSYRYFKTVEPLTLRREIAVLDPDGRTARELAQSPVVATLTAWPNRGWWVLGLAADVTTQQIPGLVAEWAAMDLEFVSPVFDTRRGGRLILTPHAIVRSQRPLSASERTALLEGTSFEVVDGPVWAGLARAYRLRTTSRNGLALLSQINALADLKSVEFGEPDFLATGMSCVTRAPREAREGDVLAGGTPPNDPGFPALWGLNNDGINNSPSVGFPISGLVDLDMEILEAWDLTTGTPGTVVAVIDTGIEVSHPDLAANIAGGFDTTNSGQTTGAPVNLSFDSHGTAVAGCIAAVRDNMLGTAGVAPDAKVLSARAHTGMNAQNAFTFTVSDVTDALDMIYGMGIRITCNANVYNALSSAITAKYDETRGLGVVHFAAAGNGGANALSYPASLDSVLGVTGIDPLGGQFGDHDATVAFAAPSTAIYTTDLTGTNGTSSGDYAFHSAGGTSFSCAYAAGVAALLVSDTPGLSAFEIESHLLETTKTFLAGSADDLGDANLFGHGLVNAFGALLNARAAAPPTLWMEFLGNQAGSEFGHAVALLRDLTGAGPPYLAVGAPYFDLEDNNGNVIAADIGRVYIYDTSTGMEVTHFDGDGPGDLFGFSLAAIPVAPNGNYERLVVGAPRLNHPNMASGYVKVIHSDLAIAGGPLMGQGNNLYPGDNFGYAVAALGSLATSTYQFVAGAPAFDNPMFGGYIRVETAFNGNPNPNFTPPSDGTIGFGINEYFGAALATGDLDNDGLPDIVVGIPGVGNGGSSTTVNGGGIQVVQGDAGLSLGNLGSTLSPDAGAYLGHSVAVLEGLTSPTSQDIAIGIPALSSTTPGKVVINTGPPSFGYIATIEGVPGDELGSAMTVVGDITGDGLPELAVAAPRNHACAGEVRIESLSQIGNTGVLGAVTLNRIVGPTAGGKLGAALGSGADIDGDGRNDLAVGAPLDNTMATNAGAARIYLMAPPASFVGPGGVGSGDGLCSLSVNWSFGGPQRVVQVPMNDPFTIRLIQVPPKPLILFARTGIPAPTETYVLPSFVGGLMSFDPTQNVSVYDSLAFGTHPVANVVASFPFGATVPVTVTLQGIIYTPATLGSGGTGFSISNAVTLQIQ